MPKYKVTILTATEPIIVTIEASSYDQDLNGKLDFYRGKDNRKVASFRSWDYVELEEATQPEVPTP